MKITRRASFFMALRPNVNAFTNGGILGKKDGAVERNRTSDPVLTKDVLYP